MKNSYIILFLLFFISSCNDQKLTYKEAVITYYNAFDSGDFNEMKTVLSDSITIIGGDYVMPFNQDSFYEHFKWDSIFKTSYKLLEIEEKNNQVYATVASKSIKNEFLKNNPLTCTFKISFESRKISKIEDFEYIGTDWEKWVNERDSLVPWISKNHPKLDGFVHDLTMKGAMNYVKAIELYQNDKKALQPKPKL